jgi:integrase
MAPRPRIRRRANWPANMHEPRPGYYTWRDPRDGKTHVLGRIALAQAIYEAQEANAIVETGKTTKTLAQRLTEERKTVADLIGKMPTDGKPNTLAARKSYDDVIRKELGSIECRVLTVENVSDVIEAIKARGKMRWAQAIRSRMVQICAKGMALGWMEKNVAEITEKMKVKVQRKRLTLDGFKAIFEKAPQVADWLPNAMLLALISGQDRSTVARWERESIVGDMAIVRRSKTEVRIAIPLKLHMDAIGMSLADVIKRCTSTGIESKYLVHHQLTHVRSHRGSPVKIGSVSQAFADARELAGIKGEHAPTFHEIRSLTKRLYMEQGGVDTKALLGHSDDSTANLYANSRGLEPIKVKID